MEKIAILKLEKIEKYNLYPKLCKECNNPIDYNKRSINSFCDHSCSAKFNNKLRFKTIESKKKTSESLKQFYLHNENPREKISGYCKLYEIICKNCNKFRLVGHRIKYNKTCGNKDCIIQLSVGVRNYQNGNKKLTWFYNKFEDKDVLLESSWEVQIAQYLVDSDIKWIRPKFIKWKDSFGKTRRYFPDFYLTDYNIYLDPKNPYCIKKDEEKLKEVQKEIKLIFGNPDMIEEWLTNNCKK